jgi:hypothetical protein
MLAVLPLIVLAVPATMSFGDRPGQEIIGTYRAHHLT